MCKYYLTVVQTYTHTHTHVEQQIREAAGRGVSTFVCAYITLSMLPWPFKNIYIEPHIVVHVRTVQTIQYQITHLNFADIAFAYDLFWCWLTGCLWRQAKIQPPNKCNIFHSSDNARNVKRLEPRQTAIYVHSQTERGVEPYHRAFALKIPPPSLWSHLKVKTKESGFQIGTNIGAITSCCR